MGAEHRLQQAIARAAYEQALENGFPGFFDDALVELGKEVGASPQETRQVQREMRDAWLLYEKQPTYFRATPRLLLQYEESDRQAAYRMNEIRRWMLEEVGRVDTESDRGGSITVKHEEGDPYTATEQYVAAQTLAYLGFLEMADDQLPALFSVKLGTQGYEALRDEALLRSKLPISVTEDEEGQIIVAPDAFREVITSCEQALQTLGWKQALTELARGDQQFKDKDWVNAVREYYAAAESGLKYALGVEADVEDEGSRALKRLAGQASRDGLIPANYAALFGFADSIRSPRSHGGGPRADAVGEVEVGQAEALLMGNHTRALLLYLAQRISVS